MAEDSVQWRFLVSTTMNLLAIQRLGISWLHERLSASH